MDIPDITQSTAFSDAVRKQPVAPAADVGAVPFSRMMNELLNGAESEQQSVDTEVKQLLTGESSNFHEVSLAVARADLSFRFMMQIRDQLISTYREVMRMQI